MATVVEWKRIFAGGKIESRMLNYTTTTLKKLETLFEELDYEIRYEKGSFQSGYCLVEARKMAVVNRFFDTEARINALLDILSSLEMDESLLSEKSRDVLKKGKKMLDKAEETPLSAIPAPSAGESNPQSSS